MLKEKRLFLLDIDGTVCMGQQLISGTRESPIPRKMLPSRFKRGKGKRRAVCIHHQQCHQEY